jgi:hypothetical protein
MVVLSFLGKDLVNRLHRSLNPGIYVFVVRTIIVLDDCYTVEGPAVPVVPSSG